MSLNDGIDYTKQTKEQIKNNWESVPDKVVLNEQQAMVLKLLALIEAQQIEIDDLKIRVSNLEKV